MDELDQLVTKNQGVMYNFFNWPTFPGSKLIVIAVANTMDLPERMLSNKISSRLGLTRIQFPGYTYHQLQEIIESRLLHLVGHVVEKEAIEFASRKVAGVSGDARRALDICRRAVEIAETSAIGESKQVGDKGNEVKSPITVSIDHIRRAIDEAISSPLYLYIRGLPVASKLFLAAILTRVRRTGLVDVGMGDILEETTRLCQLSPNANKLVSVLFDGTRVRMAGFLNAVTELVEGGILVQQSMKGERSANIRLAMGQEELKNALRGDNDVEGML